MEIKIWSGGLQQQEVTAIEEIEKSFSGKNIMFPWKGYAGFRFVSAKGEEGEFDLVIITHCNVIIVELKDWNHEPITSNGDRWYKGTKDMGRSPVSVTQKKVFTLKEKLDKVNHLFTNKGYTPFINFFVVITGNADFSKLPESELSHTISLKEFIKFADQKKFDAYFRPHRNAQTLNKDFRIFDNLFGVSQTTPKPWRMAGYKAMDLIFEHPKQVYKEFTAKAENSLSEEALLRIWDFKRIGSKANTPDGRAEIVSREREVLQYIKHHNLDLYNHCLRSLTSFQKDELTSEYGELFELPPSHIRFNEFVGKYGNNFSEQDLYTITKLLIAKFADLHNMKIAHRDINDHSLWISPSKVVALSNFISAYHQPAGTVGDYRSILSVGAVEEEDMQKGLNLTPYQKDVHALGVVAWHLLTGCRISPNSLKDLQDEMLLCEKWYAKILLTAVSTGDYKNASALFDALMQAEPTNLSFPTFDDSELDKYRQSINLSRKYPEDRLLSETDEKEIYLSNGYIVKAWLNCGGQNDATKSNLHALNFLKKIDKLRIANLSNIPAIRDYGIASKSSSLYLVTDSIEGVIWDIAQISNEEKIGIIEKFISVIEHLHEIGISHGDIHPKNVMLTHENNSLCLIDIPDFSIFGNEPKNHNYSPENIDGCTPFERDNFALMKMSCELLGISWGDDSSEYPEISKAIQAELTDTQFGFKSIGRFKKALLSDSTVEEQNIIKITLDTANEPIAILPDNGHLYVKVEPNERNISELKITFFGIGGSLSAIYDKQKQFFTYALRPRLHSVINRNDKEQSQLELNTGIHIIPGQLRDMSTLTDALKDNEAFERAITLLDITQKNENKESEIEYTNKPLSLELQKAFESQQEIDSEDFNKEIRISTRTLWRAILDTELEASPNIEVSGIPLSKDGYLMIPYSADSDPLIAFDSTDKVTAVIDNNGQESSVGNVELKKSTLNEVRLTELRSAAYKLSIGDTIYFRSEQDGASLRKRKAALERLLEYSGTIPDLVELFDPSCANPAQTYDITLTDEDFARYDRIDVEGNRISLNEQQRKAFAKLINNGPLSLLQGPPGTGKTEFIAAFVHYLIEKQNTRRILLVSQSHEAVNNAAERVRNHCRRLGNELEIVRFSNRESAVSDGLKDVYSHAITVSKRELFIAELKYRVEVLSDAIGLDPRFISDFIHTELKLFKQIDDFKALLNLIQDTQDKIELKELEKIAINLDASIRTTLADEYGITMSNTDEIFKAKEIVISKLRTEYNIRPDEMEKVTKLAKISKDMLSAMSGERVNYDEFYARARQLVVGTCVGIGQGHIGIKDNIYDWVIIDEAARSISSELAVAMQSAKRVLLVGDHLQLPPLYSEEHKKALARELGINGTCIELDEVLCSDFERAFNSQYGNQVNASLLTQYRMAEPIGRLVSEIFYKGNLLTGRLTTPDIYTTAPISLINPVTWLDTAEAKVRAYHNERDGSFYNDFEVNQIISILEEIAKNSEFFDQLSALSNGEAAIGIICMYAEQKRLLRQKFSQKSWPDGFKDMVKIDTVDSYQGKENRIIILSLTRSDAQHSPGFLRLSNRINVAMSRAMDRLLIVGNAEMWKDSNNKFTLGKVVTFMSNQGKEAGYVFISAKSNKERK